MRYRYSKLLYPIQVLADFVMLNTSFLVAYTCYFKHTEFFHSNAYSLLAVAFNVVWAVLLFVIKPYQLSRLNLNIDNLLSEFFLSVFLHICIISLGWVIIRGYGFSRAHLFLTYGTFLLLGVVWRMGALLALKLYRLSGYNYRNYIIVGNSEIMPSIKAFYDEHPELGYRFLGYFCKNEDCVSKADSIEKLEQFIQENKVDYIYCNLASLSPEMMRKIVEISENLQVKVNVTLDYRGFLTNKATIEYHDYMPVISLSTKPYSNIKTEVFKRAFDIGFSVCALLVCFPIMLLIALAVRLTSAGPVFFTQDRSGRGGVTFKIIKFRSMHVNMKAVGSQHSQGKKDPRITPIGNFLRQTRLDELPQFINVLKGDMSIVGPRPLARYDVDMLMDNSPEHFKKILTIKPGITSIGQIKVGYADNLETAVRRMKYDLLYIKNISLATDIWLIFQTVKVMVLARGR